MKTKVHAFTLSELVIVMVISVIVIGLAFTVLSIVKRHLWSIEQNFQLNTELNRLEQSLWIDTIKFNAISYNEKQAVLKFKSSIDSTSYQFDNNYVIKGRDTFKIAIVQKIFFFNGIETKGFKIDAFKLGLSKNFKEQHLFVFKQNDASQFID